MIEFTQVPLVTINARLADSASEKSTRVPESILEFSSPFLSQNPLPDISYRVTEELPNISPELAYTRSAQRYTAIRQSLGDPDPFRLKYRSEIGTVIREIVQQGVSEAEAENWTAQRIADEIPAGDREQFLTTIRVELRCLHDGNIARFRIRPGEFTNWKSGRG